MKISARSILHGFGFLLALIIVAGYILPDKVSVQRSITIETKRENIFPLISDFHQWRQWSPWANIDPDAEFIIEGEGLGQKMHWVSQHPQVGSGSQKIAAMMHPEKIVSFLSFQSQGTAKATILLTPEGANGDLTNVQWKLETNMREGVPVLMKPMATYAGFFMDRILGSDYEKGLKNLKEVAENNSSDNSQ